MLPVVPWDGLMTMYLPRAGVLWTKSLDPNVKICLLYALDVSATHVEMTQQLNPPFETRLVDIN